MGGTDPDADGPPDGPPDGPVVYTSPVLRRWSVLFVVAAIAVAAAIGLVAYWKNRTYTQAFVTALFITVGLLALIILGVLAATLPTRIEVTEQRIRLVAPRAITRYDPTQMQIRRTMHSDFALVRKSTGRTLARFRPVDAERAADAFAAAGTDVV